MNNTYGGKIKAFWTMGFGSGASGDFLKEMANLMFNCGG